jgi:hypothetical protein
MALSLQQRTLLAMAAFACLISLLVNFTNLTSAEKKVHGGPVE